MEMQFTPTIATLYVCLGLEVFFIFLHFNYWLKRKSNNVHLYLALWFTNATVYTISRLFQFFSTNIPLTPYYGKVGGATFFLAAYIGMLFVNNYVDYKPGKKEKLLWQIAVFVPLILMIATEIFITNIPIQRYTIFNESFYGALQGDYYLPIAIIRPFLFLVLFIRLINSKKPGTKYIIIGFGFSVLFLISDMSSIFLNLKWIRFYDYAYVPLGIAYTMELINNYNNMFNRMEVLIDERTKELTSANVHLKEEIKIRRIAEEHALINQDRFAGIYNAVNDAIFIHDARTKAIVDFNNSVLKMFKFDKQIARSITIEDISENIPPFTMSEVDKYFERALQGEKILFEWRSKDIEGKVFWSEVNMSAADIGNDKFVIVTLRDVSKRKETERELQEYRTHLEELVKKRTAELNNAMAEQMSLNDALQKANEELKLQSSNLIKAMDDLKIAQTKIIESEKMAALGILTAGIAHEINNPLNYIVVSTNNFEPVITDLKTAIGRELKALVTVIKDQNNNGSMPEEIEQRFDDLKKMVGYIGRGTERISEIVKGLRLFVRSDTEVKHVIDIHEHLDAVIVMLEHHTGDRIKIIKEYGDIPKYNCFPGKLSQVFMNLLMNSIQAIENKGIIKINTSCSADNSSLQISFTDDGCGIPEEVKEKIFEPFFTTKEVGKGTGLGLSIVFGIIEEHNGKIELFDKENGGTQALISLPL